MTLVLLSANHHEIDLADVERLATGAEDLGPRLREHDAVRGAMVLSTCNRLELYLDAVPGLEDDAAAHAREALAEHAGLTPREVGELTREFSRLEAVRHLFDVVSGLDSMVVGEREITGQVRRAIARARADAVSTPTIETAVQRALRASRKVAMATDLARSGRSVVSVALDLAAAVQERPGCRREAATWHDAEQIAVPGGDWSGARAVLVGTGAYAGATLAALRRAGCTDVSVWSGSDRAEGFAARHGCVALPAGDRDALAEATARADLLVTCRGTGGTTIDVALMRRALDLRGRLEPKATLVVIDLALHADVAADVRHLPGLALLDLESVRKHSPAAIVGEVARAEQIVGEAVRDLTAEHAGRAMDDVVVAMRASAAQALEAELERLPRSGIVSADDAAQALRRLTARLLHEPTVLARAAGREGCGEEFVDALTAVSGTDYRHLLPRSERRPAGRTDHGRQHHHDHHDHRTTPVTHEKALR